jgi:hypothetical protein
MKLKYRRDIPLLMKEFNLPMIGAEIGVAEGYNSADLLSNGIEKLYMIDIWKTENVKGDGSMDQKWHDKNYNDAINKVSKFGNKAIILKGFSQAMSILVPDNSLGFVYLDAGHSYEDVYNDLSVWIHKLVNGGIMAGHDYLNKSYGVMNAINNFTYGRYKVHIIEEDKEEDAGFWFLNK